MTFLLFPNLSCVISSTDKFHFAVAVSRSRWQPIFAFHSLSDFQIAESLMDMESYHSTVQILGCPGFSSYARRTAAALSDSTTRRAFTGCNLVTGLHIQFISVPGACDTEYPKTAACIRNVQVLDG